MQQAILAFQGKEGIARVIEAGVGGRRVYGKRNSSDFGLRGKIQEILDMG
ncbi:MAG TPA: hypothetical protein VM578_06435 [Candidatus Saccharimonadales bacterium]|nr:hypothetical protein [Candidatus Saccharimonadales bacterium]